MKLPIMIPPKVVFTKTNVKKESVLVVPISNKKAVLKEHSKYMKFINFDNLNTVQFVKYDSKTTLMFVQLPKKEEMFDVDIKKFGFNIGNSSSKSASVILENWEEIVKFFSKAVFNSQHHLRGDIIEKDPEARIVELILYGLAFGAYVFDYYMSEKSPKLSLLTILHKEKLSSNVTKKISEMENYTQCLWFERDLVNISPSTTTPKWVSEHVKSFLVKSGFKVQILNETQLKQKKYTGLLAVAGGSDQPPRYLIATYSPPNAKKHVAMVGKGIIFDTGGVNLKPDGGKNMKGDMSGSATVAAAAALIAKNKDKVKLTVFLPFAENHLGGNAYRPDDVIVYRNKVSVEVENTDAEGRMILAEGLIDGSKLKPDVMLDMATLTGACAVAVGREGIGFMTNSKEISKSLIDCSSESTETLVELPLIENYYQQLKSNFAEVKHTGGRYGGAITAALFLKKFVGTDKKGNDIPWVHFDLSSAYAEAPFEIYKAGATGVGILSVIKFIRNISK